MKFILQFSTFVAASAALKSPPPGAIVVAKSGGDFDSITQALLSLDAGERVNQTIYIRSGLYSEQVYIPTLRGDLVIYGETDNAFSYAANTVTISSNGSLTDSGHQVVTLSNSAAASKIYNVNVVNNHGLALRATGTQQGYYGCRFIGHTDTLYSDVGGTQIFAKSLIEGTIDFIFGRYTRIWFDEIDLRVRLASQGYITASERASPTDPSYFVFNNSTVMSAEDESVKPGSYFLGRPESAYARVVFQNKYMSDVVNGAGWSEWSDSQPNTNDVLFGEYRNSGAGSKGKRASFATALNSPLAIADILNDRYKTWVDAEYLS